MFSRQTSGSVVCPACGRLVAVSEKACPHCGRARPGMWGFTALFRSLGADLGFVRLVIGACGILYLVSLVANPQALGMRGGLFSILSPDPFVLFRLGSSGLIPVVGYGRWWTVLSAGWLHGSLLHIAFNLMWIRDIAPAVAELYGAGRMVVIYTVASASGFALTTLVAFAAPGLPLMLHGATSQTIGASAAIFGLFGALIAYGQRTGQSHMRRLVWGWILAGVIFGVVMQGVDNWAHAGGFLGGWLAAKALDPLKPERTDHVIAAVVCLVASAAAVVASIVAGGAN
jgi:rhomboid protease GluP